MENGHHQRYPSPPQTKMENGKHPPPGGYQARLRMFRESDNERDAMVAELIQRLEALQVEHETLQDNYTAEAESRLTWQRMVRTKDKELSELKRTIGASKEVYVLVDGDGAIFLDELIHKGRDGGAEAAHKLQTEIKKYLQATYPEEHIESWSIVVNIYLNMEGLIRKLQACGIVNAYKEFADFARSFTVTQPYFDVVDVGAGKENADFKLRKQLELVLRRTECAHVIVGPCHDYGYLTEFRQYDSSASQAKITLLEAGPAQPGFQQLGFGRLSVPGVFRSQSLPDALVGPGPGPATASAPAPPPGFPPPARVPSAEGGASLMSPLRPEVAYPPPPSTKPDVAYPPPSGQPTGSTWAAKANLGGPGPEGGFTVVNRKKQVQQPKFYEVNASNYRVDPVLPKASISTIEKFNARRATLSANPCNNYHITGYCRNGSSCIYEHGERLPADEANFLRTKARGSPCASALFCDDVDCFLGHHCSRSRSCIYGAKCHFYKTHGLDFTPARRIFEDGTEVDLTTNL